MKVALFATDSMIKKRHIYALGFLGLATGAGNDYTTLPQRDLLDTLQTTHVPIIPHTNNTTTTLEKHVDNSHVLQHIMKSYDFRSTDKHFIDPHNRRIVAQMSFATSYNKHSKNYDEIFPVSLTIGGSTLIITGDEKGLRCGEMTHTVQKHDPLQSVYDFARTIMSQHGIESNVKSNMPVVDGVGSLTKSYYTIHHQDSTTIAHIHGNTSAQALQTLQQKNIPHDSISQELSAHDIYLSNQKNQTTDLVPPLGSFDVYDADTINKIFSTHNISPLVRNIFSTGLITQESALDAHARSSSNAQSFWQMMPGYVNVMKKAYDLKNFSITNLTQQATLMARHLENKEHAIRTGTLTHPISELIDGKIHHLHQSYQSLLGRFPTIDQDLMIAFIMVSSHHNGNSGVDAALQSFLWNIEHGHITLGDDISTMEIIEHITFGQWSRNLNRNSKQSLRRKEYSTLRGLSPTESRSRSTSIKQRKKHSALYFFKTFGLTLRTQDADTSLSTPIIILSSKDSIQSPFSHKKQ